MGWRQCSGSIVHHSTCGDGDSVPVTLFATLPYYSSKTRFTAWPGFNIINCYFYNGALKLRRCVNLDYILAMRRTWGSDARQVPAQARWSCNEFCSMKFWQFQDFWNFKYLWNIRPVVFDERVWHTALAHGFVFGSTFKWARIIGGTFSLVVACSQRWSQHCT